MPLNVAVSKSQAVSQMEKIRTDADTFLTDMEEAYTALKDGLADSQGDFVEALKVQIDSEKAVMEETVLFFKTLLTMMNRAEEDFETVDEKYATGKMAK